MRSFPNKLEYRKVTTKSDKFVEIPLRSDHLGSVVIDDVYHPVADVLQSLNYGTGELLNALTLRWGQRKDIRELVDIWDAALIAEVSSRVLGTARARVFPQDGFEGLIRRRDNHILLGLILRFSEAYDVSVLTPRAYVALELCEFLEYLKETVKSDSNDQSMPDEVMPDEFENRRQKLWEKTFGKLP
jgi:hypothetical protein